MRLKRLRRRILDPVIGFSFAVTAHVTGHLRYSLLMPFSHLLGSLAWTLMGNRRRKLIDTNLIIAFPEWSEERYREVARKAVNNVILGFLEFLWFTGSPAKISQIVDFADSGLSDLFRDGIPESGILLVTPHLGNWELLSQAVAAKGIKLSVVARRIRNRWIARLTERARSFHGVEIIPARGAARGMLRAFRSGRTVGTLIDQNSRPHRGGVFVDFFGLPAATARGPASLAMHTGARVIPVICVREKGRLKVHTASLPKAVGEYRDSVELTQDLMKVQERLIRRYPEQYAWLYKRWRYIPPGTPPEQASKFPPYAKEYIPPEKRKEH